MGVGGQRHAPEGVKQISILEERYVLFNSGNYRHERCKEFGVYSPSEGIYSATTICAKAFTTYIKVTVPTPNVLAADVLVTAIFH